MANISVRITHNLLRDELLPRVKNLIRDFQTEHPEAKNVRERWSGFLGEISMVINGAPVSGIIMVKDGSLEVSGTVPVLVHRLFGKQIESGIEQRLTKIISRRERGERKS